MKTISHGTINAYSNLGCRCEECVAYGKTYRRETKSKKPWSHGTADGYTRGFCRCELCKDAKWFELLVYRYGITKEQYFAKLEEQGGGCAVCHRLDAIGPGKRFAMDHDHSCCPGAKTCGKCLRGLLCNKCNTAIGLLDDSPERARALADYMEEHS